MSNWKNFEESILSKSSLKSDFIKNPAKTLKENGLNINDLPEDIAQKISGGSFWSSVTHGITTAASAGHIVTSVRSVVKGMKKGGSGAGGDEEAGDA